MSYVAVLGDFNDTPTSAPLAPLLAKTDLRDISTHPGFDDGGRTGTFGTCTAVNKIDYILLSPALYARPPGEGSTGWAPGSESTAPCGRISRP